MRFSALLLLVAPVSALRVLAWPALPLNVMPWPSSHGLHSRMCTGDTASGLDGADESSSDEDAMECEARVVTELVDASGQPLPDRFVMAMRALQGEFTPQETDVDNERSQDLVRNSSRPPEPLRPK